MRHETKRISGNRQERHEWLEAIRQPLLRYCLQITGSSWDAEDLVQDTIVRLLKAGTQRPEQEVGFRYVCRTARNLWIDRFRRSKRITVTAQRDAAELLIGGAVHDSSSLRMIGEGMAYETAGFTHDAMHVREHLEELAWRLSPKPFVILLLMEVFDFTAKETAAWIGGTETAVQVALSRARRRLQSLHRSKRDDGHGAGRPSEANAHVRTPMPASFFEAVLDAFHRHHPAAIQEAYLSLIASGGQLQEIRALGGKLYFTFLDPDGNVLLVSA